MSKHMVTAVSVLKSTMPYKREAVGGNEWSVAHCRVPTVQDAR